MVQKSPSFLQPFVFEEDARDPWSAALVAAVLIATAVVAAWLPSPLALCWRHIIAGLAIGVPVAW